jgi:hypothetical protein
MGKIVMMRRFVIIYLALLRLPFVTRPSREMTPTIKRPSWDPPGALPRRRLSRY